MLDSERQLLLGQKPLHKSLWSNIVTWSNMIQHHSGCIYFSTEKFDPWHFLHTTNLPESVFTRELTGSLNDLTSGGSNKNGSSQNKGETGSRLQQFEIELVPYSLLTCILLEVECTCFDLIGVDDMEPATIQTRKPLLEVGTTTKKAIHEYRQCLFSFSWELQTSLSHWSMIYFLCVFCSAYPNSGKWVGETSGIFVVHVILVVAIVSWDPNSTVDLWMRFFRKGHWDGFHLPFYVFNLWEDIVFSLVCFLMLPCRLNSDTGKKAGIPANKAHVGMVEGPKTIPSQHRDLAGFLKTEEIDRKTKDIRHTLDPDSWEDVTTFARVTIGFARPCSTIQVECAIICIR